MVERETYVVAVGLLEEKEHKKRKRTFRFSDRLQLALGSGQQKH
jgi:hypothetical protein